MLKQCAINYYVYIPIVAIFCLKKNFTKLSSESVDILDKYEMILL